MTDRAPGDIRAETEDPRTFVRMLVLGEALTPRGDLGPLARFWVPAARWRRVARKPLAGTRDRPER